MLQLNSKVLLSSIALACAHVAFAGGFYLNIGSSVAANAPAMKSAVLVVRPTGCDEPAKAQITGVAEGVVNGVRRSVPLKLNALPTPGVYAVMREWPSEGVWVVNITGNYRGAITSALVPIGPKGFLRESSKFSPRAATEAEIEASLKTLAAVR